jgi:Tol biopolymer transport system component
MQRSERIGGGVGRRAHAIRAVSVSLALLSVWTGCGGDPNAPSQADERSGTPAATADALQTATGKIAFSSDRSGTWRIYVANADGSGLRSVTKGEAPAWSADGRKIAFHRAGGLYVIDASGTNERSLGAGWNPTWSPDGRKLAFHTGVGLGGGLYVMSADGSNRRLLVSHEFASPGWGDYAVQSPAWSPDGRTIAFVRANYDEGFGLYTTSADGSGSPRPLPNGWAQDRPAWSPDGSRVAFETVDYGGDQVGSLAFPSGSDFRAHVTNATGYAGDPAWSPDGRSIAFTRSSPRGAPTRIFVVRADGSVRRLIPEAQSPANASYRDREPAWSWAAY